MTTQELDFKQLVEIRGDLSCILFSLPSVVRAHQSNQQLPLEQKLLLLR